MDIIDELESMTLAKTGESDIFSRCADEIKRLRSKLAHALALTDTGSLEYRLEFEGYAGDPPVRGWRVVEKIREVLQ